MPAGAMAMYREATGGEARDSTTGQVEAWDTIVYEDLRTFERNPTSQFYIKLKELGKYFVAWNLTFEHAAGVNKRTEHEAYWNHATTVGMGEGCSTGYGRSTGGCEEVYLQGYGIFDIPTANNNFYLGSKNSSTETGASVTRRANLCGCSILKLDDDWDYARVDQNGGMLTPDQTITTAWQAVLWDQELEIDTATFSWVAEAPPMTAPRYRLKVLVTGWYLVTWSIHVQSAATNIRKHVLTHIRVGGSAKRHGYAGNYIRSTGGCDDAHVSGMALCYVVADSYIELMVRTDNDSGTLQSTKYTNMQVVKLPDTINKCRVHSNFLAPSVDQTNYQILWDAEENDDTAFDHSLVSNKDNILIKKPGHFLFGFGNMAERASGTNRYNTIFRFRKNGVLQQYGNSGMYNRGTDGINPSYYSACMGGIILPNLVIDDIIEVELNDESTASGTAPTLTALSHGVFGIYLPSLFPPKGWPLMGVVG